LVGMLAGTKPKKKKKRSSMGESIALLKSSPKILNLALLVVCYGVGHRLFEYAWKGQLRVLYPSVESYQSILADVSIWTGATTIGLMLTSRFIFQVCSLLATALRFLPILLCCV
jgi:ATP:ADP antiporter, AAA family